MTYSVCILHKNVPVNTQSYPYKDVSLLFDKSLGYFRFPEQEGDPESARTGFSSASPELRNALDSIPEDRSPVFSEIVEPDDGHPIVIMEVPDSYAITDPKNPVITQTHGAIVRVIMDEIRQGRVCHAKIHSSVRNLFFSSPERASKIRDTTPSTTPYFYEPASEYVARLRALVPSPAGTPNQVLHSPEYYRIPMIGYHGTAEAFVEPAITKGLRATKKGGMYGNDAFYFGSFYKAIRYAFRDSGYASMPQRTPLYRSDRPAGFMEVMNTAHADRRTEDIHTDLIRDAPALVRYVLFVKNPIFMPKDAKNIENIGSPKVLRSIPVKTSKAFITYQKTPAGTGKTIYSRDYLSSQVGVPLFKGGTSGIDVPTTDNSDLEVPSDSTREETTLRLYRAVHVATRPAFA